MMSTRLIPTNIIPDCEAEGIDMRVRYHPSYEADILLIFFLNGL